MSDGVGDKPNNGVLIWRGHYDIVDENGNVIPPDKSDWDYTPDEEKCLYNEAYCKKVEKPKKKKKKKQVKKENKEEVVNQPGTPNEAHEVAQHPEQQATTATVSVPSAPDHLADLKNAIPNTGNDMVTVILSGIAVMGGATAWKFYSQKSANAHEERMKKLELDSQSNNNHQACAANNAALAARIDSLEGKLSKVESSTLNLSGGGLDDIDERLTKLEKSIKKPRSYEKKSQ